MTSSGDDDPTLKAINPITWIESTAYRELGFGSSLEAFPRQRARLLAVLESLSPDGWFRSASVVGAGRPLERSVLDYADRMARHERAYWKQVEGTVNAVVVG